MKLQNKKPLIVILSAFKTGKSYKENKVRNNLLESMLHEHNLATKHVEGVWQGESEDSILVALNSKKDLETVKNFAFKNFDQDVILFSNENRDSILITKDGGEIELGKLKRISEKEALKKQCFTYDPSSQTYWHCN